MVLPKSMRLKGHRCFSHLFREGVRYHESSMLLRVVKADPTLQKRHIIQSESKTCRCAIAISSKVSKKAVTRNRLRRIIHEHLKTRLFESTNNSNKWLLLSLKPQSSNKDPSELLKECDSLLFKSGLLL